MSEVRCPRCRRMLTLPPAPGARKIRCQACNHLFIHQSPPMTIDDHVLEWLNEDQPRDDDEHDELVSQVQASVAGAVRPANTGQALR